MTRDLIDATALRNFVEACCPDVRWHGEYGGRFYFKGLAISCDTTSDLTAALVRISKEPEFDGLERIDHSDSLGRGEVHAWHLRRFDPESVDALRRAV